MKFRIYFFQVLSLGVLMTSGLLAMGDGWGSDYKAAKKQAAEEGKDLLIEFTGSDWCPPCMALMKTITGVESFVEGASDDFVLLALDYPKQTPQTEEVKAHNAALLERYQVRAYPTVLLCDATGKVYAKTGFQKGTPATYLALLAELKKIKGKRDEAMAKVGPLKGVQKAKALIAALEPLQREVRTLYYEEEKQQILALDPEDVTGLRKKEEVVEKIDGLMAKVMPAINGGQTDEVVNLVDEFQKAEIKNLSTDQKQQLAIIKVEAFFRVKDAANALKALDEVVEIAPESNLSKQVPKLKSDLVQRLGLVEEKEAKE